MPEDNIRSAIEALLFASDRPLALQAIRDALDNLDIEEIRKVLEELKLEYEQANRGMRITEVAGGFQMVTSPAFAPFLNRLYKSRKAEKLSRPALETLAIIAYKQPVTRSHIQAIRDVNADGMLKGLLEKGLIRIAGRKKAPGRPYVFATTRQFLEYFGLKSLEELPKIEEFKNTQAAKENVNEAAKVAPTN